MFVQYGAGAVFVLFKRIQTHRPNVTPIPDQTKQPLNVLKAQAGAMPGAEITDCVLQYFTAIIPQLHAEGENVHYGTRLRKRPKLL